MLKAIDFTKILFDDTAKRKEITTKYSKDFAGAVSHMKFMLENFSFLNNARYYETLYPAYTGDEMFLSTFEHQDGDGMTAQVVQYGAINANTKNVEEAWKLLKYILDMPATTNFAKYELNAAYYAPVNRNAYQKCVENLKSQAPGPNMKVGPLSENYLQKKMQKESLERTVEAGGTQGELAYWQLQNLEETISYMEQLIEAGCIVSTKDDCVLIGLEYEVGDTTKDAVQIEVALPERGCYLEWTVSAENYEEYKGTAVIQGQNVSLSWEQPELKKGVYIYRSELPEVTECVHGEPVEVEFLYTSQEYRAVLPKSCIWYDNDGFAYIYQIFTRNRNFGEESYVRKIGVTIQEQDNINVVVDTPLKGVVERSSMKLADKMSVVVIEE